MPAANAKPRDAVAGLHGFATCRGFVSSRHRDACRASRHRLESNTVEKFIDRYVLNFRPTIRPKSPRRDPSDAPRGTTFSYAPAFRPGINLERSVEGGRRPFASGTPAIRGARNSETLRQQPDQPLVREPIPTRITVAISVDAFPRPPSIRIVNYFHERVI